MDRLKIDFSFMGTQGLFSWKSIVADIFLERRERPDHLEFRVLVKGKQEFIFKEGTIRRSLFSGSHHL